MIRLLLLSVAFGLFSVVPAFLATRTSIPPAWQVRLGSLAVAGIGLSAVSLLAGILFPEALAARGVADLWHKCAEAFRALAADPLGRWTSLVAGGGLGVVLGRFLWTLVTSVRRTRRARVSGNHPQWVLRGGAGVYVLPVDHPEAYSVGGMRRQVVMTRGLIEALDEEERRAVLLHEEGHLRGRHHALLLMARTVNAALFRFGAAAAAVSLLERAMEESADDFAASELDSSETVASGLSKAALAGIRSPAEALALGDSAGMPERVRRLLSDRNVPRWIPAMCLVSAGTLFGLIALTQAIAGLAWLAGAHHMLGWGAALLSALST